MRIKFQKGFQRKFIKYILEMVNAPSLRELTNRISGINYSTLKNYYNEERLLPEEIFDDLLNLSGLNRENLDFEFEVVYNNWGQVKGGKKSKRK